MAAAQSRGASKILLRREEAAELLSMSLDHFERYVQPRVRLVRSGRLRLVPYRELERWAMDEARFAV